MTTFADGCTYDQVQEAQKHLNSLLIEEGFWTAGAGINKTSHGFGLVIHASNGIPSKLVGKQQFEGIPLKVRHVSNVVAY